MSKNKIIVAEVSKNWYIDNPPPATLLSQEFEKVINVNDTRGYKLIDWKMDRIVKGDNLNETIIAIFERKEERPKQPDINLPAEGLTILDAIDQLKEYYEKIQHPDYESVDEVMFLDIIELLERLNKLSNVTVDSLIQQLQQANPYDIDEDESGRYEGWNDCVSKLCGLFSGKIILTTDTGLLVNSLRNILKSLPDFDSMDYDP